MTTTNTKPLDTLRDGGLKATIGRRTGESGPFYTVELSRTYKDEAGNYHDSASFTGSELLRIARLAEIAYDEVVLHRAKDRKA